MSPFRFTSLTWSLTILSWNIKDIDFMYHLGKCGCRVIRSTTMSDITLIHINSPSDSTQWDIFYAKWNSKCANGLPVGYFTYLYIQLKQDNQSSHCNVVIVLTHLNVLVWLICEKHIKHHFLQKHGVHSLLRQPIVSILCLHQKSTMYHTTWLSFISLSDCFID